MFHSMIQLIPHQVVPLGHSQANGVVVVTVAALGAALLFALASVLQHRSAERESEEATFRVHHMGRLVLRPVWLAGILADAGGYVLQFIALRQGTLVVVQVLLVSGLLFALPLAAAFNRRRPTPWSSWVPLPWCAGSPCSWSWPGLPPASWRPRTSPGA